MRDQGHNISKRITENGPWPEFQWRDEGQMPTSWMQKPVRGEKAFSCERGQEERQELGKDESSGFS